MSIWASSLNISSPTNLQCKLQPACRLQGRSRHPRDDLLEHHLCTTLQHNDMVTFSVSCRILNPCYLGKAGVLESRCICLVPKKQAEERVLKLI